MDGNLKAWHDEEDRLIKEEQAEENLRELLDDHFSNKELLQEAVEYIDDHIYEIMMYTAEDFAEDHIGLDWQRVLQEKVDDFIRDLKKGLEDDRHN